MKINITSTKYNWGNYSSLFKSTYGKMLAPYKLKITSNDSNERNFASITIKSLQELIDLPKVLGIEIILKQDIITHELRIEIYDDYRE